MKKLILFGLFFVLCYSTSAQSTKFYEKAISHLSCGYNCYFIPLNVKSELFSGKVVVENASLFSYLKSVKGFDEQGYKAFMIKLFQDNQSLSMDAVTVDESGYFLVGKDLKKYSFRIINPSQDFEAILAQGCEKLIQYYFSPELIVSETNKESSCKEKVKLNAKNLYIRPRFNFDEQNNVIAKLFEMEIPVYLDDISQSLIIGHYTLK